MLAHWPSIILIVLSAYGLLLHQDLIPVGNPPPSPSPPPPPPPMPLMQPPFPPMPLMQALIAQAGGIDLFNQLAATILSQPAPAGEETVMFDSNEERDEYLAPERDTLDELIHAPAEPVDCINEALLRRPYRWVSNPAAVGPHWIRLYRIRTPGSPDNWFNPRNNMDYFWDHGDFNWFEYPFRRLFRTIHHQPLGGASLSPAARAANIARMEADQAEEEAKTEQHN